MIGEWRNFGFPRGLPFPKLPDVGAKLIQTCFSTPTLHGVVKGSEVCETIALPTLNWEMADSFYSD